MSENASLLTVAHVKALVDAGQPVLFIDSRNPVAWGSSRVKLPGALRIPIDQVERHLAALPRDRHRRKMQNPRGQSAPASSSTSSIWPDRFSGRCFRRRCRRCGGYAWPP